MRRALLGSLTCLVVAVAGGCGGESGPETFEDPASIEVEAGESFAVALDSNATTGYEWRLAEPLDGEVLSYSGSEYETDEGSEGLAGAGGTQTLTFEAGEPGSATIELEYAFAGNGERGEVAESREIDVAVS